MKEPQRMTSGRVLIYGIHGQTNIQTGHQTEKRTGEFNIETMYLLFIRKEMNGTDGLD